MMKAIFQTIFILILSVYSSQGQVTKSPKNIPQAVILLDKECTDSLKDIIRKTDNDRLRNLLYPNGTYKTPDWFLNSNSKINRYLAKKGIVNFQIEVILVGFKTYLLSHEIDEAALLRPFQQKELKWKKEDANRYTADSLRGYYIPKNLEDCIRQLDISLSNEEKAFIKTFTEQDLIGSPILGYSGMLTYNWRMWAGSRLSKYFNDLGISGDDDMSSIIINSYYRYLTGKEIDLNGQVKFYQDYRKALKKNQQEKLQKEFDEYKTGDTVIYRYNSGFVSDDQKVKHDEYKCSAKGIILNKNNGSLLIKVKVIDACDKKGILYYRIKKNGYYDTTAKKWVPSKGVVKKIKPGKEQWFYYNNWYPLDE